MNKTTTKKQTSTDLYRLHQADAKALIENILGKLAKHSREAGESPNYAHCGDVAHVVEQLEDLNSFLGGAS